MHYYIKIKNQLEGLHFDQALNHEYSNHKLLLRFSSHHILVHQIFFGDCHFSNLAA